MNTIESQQTKILQYLKEGYLITPLIALKKFGCLRLGARIFNLKRKGNDIITDMIEDKKKNKRFASYRLAGVGPKVERSLPGKTISDYSKSIKKISAPSPIQQTLF